jgi:hypothetical protein
MASAYVVSVGTIIFIFTWFFMAFSIRQIPIGRVLGTMSGAVLMIVTQILTPNEALQSISLESSKHNTNTKIKCVSTLDRTCSQCAFVFVFVFVFVFSSLFIIW